MTAKSARPKEQHGGICGLLNLTVACNQDCIFCCDGDVKNSKHHLTLDEARIRLERIAQTGADSVTIIGGEPLIHKEIVEVVRAAKALGMRVGLTSNGTLLTPQKLKALVDAGMTSIEISMHAASDELASAMSQRGFTPSRQREALKALQEFPGNRPGVAINFVLTSPNAHELPEFVRWMARDYPFIDELFINFVDPIGYPAGSSELVPTYDAVVPFLLEALDEAKGAGLSFTVDSVPGCILGPYFLYLRATKEKLQGKLYAKDTFRIENPLPDPDQSQYYRTNACFDCPISGLCPGVNFRYLEIHGPASIRPFPRELLKLDAIQFPPEIEAQALAVLPDGMEIDPPFPLKTVPFAGKDGYLSVLSGEPRFVSDQCNNGCSQCPFDSKHHPAMGQGTRGKLEGSILLTGREPALEKNFFALLRQGAKGEGSRFSTNARVFSYARWARKVAEIKVAGVTVRIPAPLSELDRITREEGARVQTEEGIDNLLEMRSFPVDFEMVVPPGTEGAVEETLEFVAQRAIHKVLVLVPGTSSLDLTLLERWARQKRLSCIVVTEVPWDL